jgi:hydrogenase maturation protein HypF
MTDAAETEYEQRFSSFMAEWKKMNPNSPGQLGTDALVAFLVKERMTYKKNHPVTEGLYGATDGNAVALSHLFHQKLAEMITKECERISRESNITTVALSGGCFQNRLLLTYVQKNLEDKGYQVLTHHLIPPNDGGIALGQALIAMERLKEKE